MEAIGKHQRWYKVYVYLVYCHSMFTHAASSEVMMLSLCFLGVSILSNVCLYTKTKLLSVLHTSMPKINPPHIKKAVMYMMKDN